MEKSASAWPGALATFLIRPIRRSELMNVPSFSPQAAAGSTRWACRAVSVVSYMSCTTRKSSRPNTSSSMLRLIHEWAGLVAMTQSPLICSLRMPSMISWYAQLFCAGMRSASMPRMSAIFCRSAAFSKSWPPSRFVVLAEQPRAHRVALSGDRVRARARPPHVAGDQGQVDQALGSPRPFVALVDAHRPPERYRLPSWISTGGPVQRGQVDAGKLGDPSGVNSRHVPGEAPRSPRCARRCNGDRSSPSRMRMAARP